MKELTNQPTCPQCGKVGYMWSRKSLKKVISLECPDCIIDVDSQTHFRWNSLAGICPDCLKHNGYPGDGTCMSCYAIKHGAGDE